MSIQRLPGAVAAQIKSSATVASLNATVLGLLRNALDAGAVRVTVSVDYGRGSCVVEDDGAGIPPDEFRVDGGLGKLYYTSKYPPLKGAHGRYGTFLASVADLSLLTIVSRGRGCSSESTLTIHNGKLLRRHITDVSSQTVFASPHGTRVTVRDLFGCMPVRARLRPLPDSAAWNRDWDDLIRSVAALLLAWPGSISATIHDEASDARRTLRGVQENEPAVRTAHLLAQAGLCERMDPESWVSVGASVSGVHVSGSVCLDPAASKRAQFLRIGVTPLSAAHPADRLYSEINKIFAESDFGATDLTKSDERTTRGPMDSFVREQRPRKAVDRWPMFSLGIDLDGDTTADVVLDDQRHDLAVIASLLRTVTVEFLKTHGFYADPATCYQSGSTGGSPSRSREGTPGSPTKKQKTAEVRGKRVPPLLPKRSRDAQSLFSSWPQTKSARSSKTKLTQAQVIANPEIETRGGSAEEQSMFFVKPDSLHEEDEHTGEACCDTSRDMKEWDESTLTSGDLKFSRARLEAATIIGQVDQKFILIRAPPETDDSGPLLILVDQHAADERCRVEALLQDYFEERRHEGAIATVLSRPMQFELSTDELSLLERSKAYFRHWGVAYDMLPPNETREADTTVLRVTALPSCIVDRCTQDPRLVVDLIRKEIWERKEADLDWRPASDSNTHWTARFYRCPRGILDLINSRACRSAIKFNDALTRDECVDLTDRLRRCSFPFQCAHGRPSMVPLLNLGLDESSNLY
ncbi:DNA mismatch repair protein MLH3 [Sporothrix schenckii 1099-18]|uniref:DNA mismatch repair protein MLH3 n=1 Tax=Sporothrix schenckii 1099-18 TaxID=1397361 RepID=A0A0F2M778_SPOSC|nr:DNA mismatch repair protein MLH3 [Sporothrix schenckii 1099-18]KJR84031.1 DNA mismatch repair protein MLH3 [Sporothrix schenckii 1099-18]